jgi:hypothetical protein
MKEVVEKRIIPAKEEHVVSKKSYQCEGCNNVVEYKQSIRPCPVCGEDLCPSCKTEYHIFDPEPTSAYEPEDDYTYYDTYVEGFKQNHKECCNKCKDKLNQKEYNNKIESLWRETGLKIAELNKEYFGDIV